MRLLLDNNPINHNRFTLNYDYNSYTISIIYRFLIHKRTQVGAVVRIAVAHWPVADSVT